jgi:CheY-like chemotaxis protein
MSTDKKPIIIIDDDDDDLETIQEALVSINTENEIIVFNDGYLFLDFIKKTENQAFFILCDLNMAKISGLELKKIIFEDEKLRMKCVSFIFLSTSRASAEVMRAYSFGVQGYFIKPNNFKEIKKVLQSIIDYWSQSQRPLGE